jgi:hypothetical protein
MRQIGDNASEAESEEISPQQTAALLRSSELRAAARSVNAPPYSALVQASSAAALIAVIDESGYLVPVCTPGDLLRAFKHFWRAAQA